MNNLKNISVIKVDVHISKINKTLSEMHLISLIILD